MMLYIKLFIYILTLFLKGALVLYLLNANLNIVWKKPYLLFGFGSGITSLLLFLGSLLHVPFHTQHYIIFGLLLLSAVGKKLFLKKQTNSWSINNEKPKQHKPSPWQNPLSLLCSSIIVIQVLFVFIHAAIIPEQSWDGRMRWGLKSEVLYTQQSVFTEYFQNPYFFVTHPNYPLLIPLQMTDLYTSLQEINEQAVKILFSFYFLMIVLTLYDYLRSRTSSLSAILFTALFSTIPLFLTNEGSATTMMADVPLALYVTLAVICLLHYIRQRNISLILPTGLILFFCAFTKLEGFVYTGILLFCLFCLYRKETNMRYQFLTQDLPLFILSFILPYIPWFVFRHSYIPYHYANYPTTIHVSYIFSRLHRMLYIIPRYISELTRVSSWHITWILTTYGLIHIIKTKAFKKETLFLFYILIGFFLFYCASHIFSSWWNSQTEDSFKKFIDVTFSRQLLHIAPVAVIFTSLSLKKLF